MKDTMTRNDRGLTIAQFYEAVAAVCASIGDNGMAAKLRELAGWYARHPGMFTTPPDGDIDLVKRVTDAARSV